jgi:hypothetical protein
MKVWRDFFFIPILYTLNTKDGILFIIYNVKYVLYIQCCFNLIDEDVFFYNQKMLLLQFNICNRDKKNKMIWLLFYRKAEFSPWPASSRVTAAPHRTTRQVRACWETSRFFPVPFRGVSKFNWTICYFSFSHCICDLQVFHLW